MKKIIIQVYNNLLFSRVEKWNLFHCLSCWDVPSLGPTFVFSQFQVLLSHLWEFKKERWKEEGRKRGEKKGVEQERWKERKNALKERKHNNKIIIKYYLKKTKQNEPAGFKLTKPVLLVFLAADNSGVLAQLFSVHASIQAASGPALQQPWDPQVQALTLLLAMGVREWGLPWLALSLVPVVSGSRKVCTLPPGAEDLGWLCPRARLGGEETGAAAAGEFPKLPLSVFFFLRKSSCSILSLHTKKGLSSHTAHLSS